MKRSLIGLILLGMALLRTFAATPAFQSFDTNDFTVTPDLAHPQMIHGSHNQIGTNVFNTVIVTNLYVTNLFTTTNIVSTNLFVTNIVVDNITITTNLFITTNVFITVLGDTNLAGLWTDTLGDYTPTQADQNQLHATNIFGVQTLHAAGAFLLDLSSTVSLPADTTNNVNPYQLGYIRLQAITNDPPNIQIRLSTGNGSGSLIVLQNAATNSGFRMLNGDPLWDDASLHLYLKGGDWVSTNKGEAIMLLGSPVGWAEIGRFGGPTNFVTGDLWQVVGGTNLQPVDLTLQVNVGPLLQVSTNGTILSGAHAIYGGYSDPGAVLSGVRSVERGDNPVAYIFLQSSPDNAESSLGQATLVVKTNQSYLFMGNKGYTRIAKLNPVGNVYPAEAPYHFDTDWQNTNNIAEFANNLTNLLSVDSTGGLIFGPGPTNVLYRNAGSLVYSNNAGLVEFDVAGASGTTKIGINSTLGRILAADGVDVQWTNGTVRTVRFWENRIHPLQSGIILGGDLSTSPITPFSNLNLNGTYYHYGYIGSGTTNYSRLDVSHTGTNGVGAGIVFDSQAAGTGGTPRDFAFQSNSVTVTTIAASTGDISIGRNTATIFPTAPRDIQSVRMVDLGDIDDGGFYFSTTTGGAGGTLDGGVSTTSASLGVSAPSGGNSYGVNLQSTGGTAETRWNRAGVPYGIISPFVPGSSTFVPFTFTSYQDSGTNVIFSLTNSTTMRFAVRADGPIILSGITKAQKTAIDPINGMIVYQTDNTPGLRAYVNGAWVILQTAADP